MFESSADSNNAGGKLPEIKVPGSGMLSPQNMESFSLNLKLSAREDDTVSPLKITLRNEKRGNATTLKERPDPQNLVKAT
jgi:hypothetical protein